ncbi:hypothetical protein CHUAL_001805 [Chamberlinius hualienensis]
MSELSIIKTEVIIIGAGLSGLCAAKLLNENGVNVQVVEARDRVGGRIFTVKQDKFGWVDLGASYVAKNQNYILRIINELGLKTYPVYGLEKCVHVSHGKRDIYESQWPQFSWRNLPVAAKEVENFLNLIDELSLEVPVEAPWTAVKAREWDSMTYQEFINCHCKTKEAREYLFANCQSNVSADPCQISLLWLLWYLRSACGNKSIWNIIDGGQERKIVGGASQIVDKLADKLKSQIHLDQPVCFIKQRDGNVNVKTINGLQFQGRYVILATPLPLMQKIHYSPSFPVLKTQLIQRTTMGTTMKCEIYYQTPFWRKLGYSGVGSCGDGIEVVCNSMDDSKPNHPYGQLTCFVVSDHALKMQSLSLDERCKYVAKYVHKLYPVDEALHPVHYIDKNWTEEQYTGGCYTCCYPPGVLARYGKCIREPFGSILFAGTETSTQWSGYMNGAVEAGERAAREAMFGLGLIHHKDVYVREPEQQWSWSNPENDQQLNTKCKL